MTTTRVNELVNILNGVFSQMKLSDKFLSKLPDNSWNVIANLKNIDIYIDIFRNDSILMENGRFVATDEMYWYSKIVPVVATVLANNANAGSKNQILKFRFRNEERERIFSCDANELISHATEIQAGDFGTTMALMDTDD